MKIAIINGPNLNLLGTREPSVYGNQSFESYLKLLQSKYRNIAIDYFQSNIEGEIVNQLHSADLHYEGILLNAAAYTHTSVAIADAVKAIATPVIEVHISNVYARESFRQTSYISPNAAGIIIGCGLNGYDLGIQQLLHHQP